MSNELDLVILKTLITNKKHALDFANEFDITKQNFFSSDVWNFANLIVSYTKSYKELPTLRVISEKISKNDKLLESTKKLWDTINAISYDDSEYKHDLDKLKKRFAEKQISSVNETLSKLNASGMDVGKAVGEMKKTIQSITGIDKVKTYESKNIKDYLPTFVEKFNNKKENPHFESGVKTGYSFLDFATNGLRPADFVLIAGESGFGKSLFLQNIAVQTWLQNNSIERTDHFTEGKNIVYFSLEMPYEDCFNRLLSRLSGVPSRKIENSSLTKEEFSKIKKCLDFINKYPHSFKIVDVANACANDLELILLDYEDQFDAIFIDYLGIMNTNDRSEEADWLKQGVVSYEVRAIARKHKLPIFSAVQLNRKSSKETSENIGLNRLARSATIATHATHVIQIESRQGEEFKNDFVWHLIKNRKGPKGKGTCYKNLACATLIDKTMENIDDSYSNNNFQDDISEELEKLSL